MPRYKITYVKSYEVETDCGENDALEIADQEFMEDIREMLSKNGQSKIMYLFNWNVEKIKKKGVLRKKIAGK